MRNKNNGITLIALIITIIVMLILVAVTISMAVNGGLFGYAGNAAKDTELAKKQELELANVDSGMTTDDLIDKYTEDNLAEIQDYFIGRTFSEVYNSSTNKFNDLDPILDASTSIIPIEVLEGEICGVQYNYHKYLAYIDENTNKFNNVIKLNKKEEFIMEIEASMINGEIQFPEMGFVKYKNCFYRLVESEDTFCEVEYQNLGSVNEIAIVTTDVSEPNYIVIRPTTNQTWIQWANDSQTTDFTWNAMGGDYSLKDTIKSVNGQTDKTITEGSGYHPCYLITMYNYAHEDCFSYNTYLSTDIINPGQIYHVRGLPSQQNN